MKRKTSQKKSYYNKNQKIIYEKVVGFIYCDNSQVFFFSLADS